jgi:hypothetical protein
MKIRQTLNNGDGDDDDDDRFKTRQGARHDGAHL